MLAHLVEPQELALDAEGLYVTDAGAGEVVALRLDGGAPTILAAGQRNPHGVAVVAGRVLWSEFVADGAIDWVFESGGAPEVLTYSPSPAELAVDDAYVYATELGPPGWWFNYRSGDVIRVRDLHVDRSKIEIRTHEDDRVVSIAAAQMRAEDLEADAAVAEEAAQESAEATQATEDAVEE